MQIVVGKKGVEFGVHKGLLTHVSSYFRAALDGNFQEAQTGMLVLRDDEPTIFRIFNQWLYFNRLYEPKRAQVDLVEPTKRQSSVDLTVSQMVRLCAFADARDIPALHNATVDALHQYLGDVWTYVSQSDIMLIYETTTAKSKLRRLVIDFYAFHADLQRVFREEKAPEFDRWPQEFLIDLIKAVATVSKHHPRRDMGRWQHVNRCEYHEHVDGVKCVGEKTPSPKHRTKTALLRNISDAVTGKEPGYNIDRETA